MTQLPGISSAEARTRPPGTVVRRAGTGQSSQRLSPVEPALASAESTPVSSHPVTFTHSDWPGRTGGPTETQHQSPPRGGAGGVWGLQQCRGQLLSAGQPHGQGQRPGLKRRGRGLKRRPAGRGRGNERRLPRYLSIARTV